MRVCSYIMGVDVLCSLNGKVFLCTFFVLVLEYSGFFLSLWVRMLLLLFLRMSEWCEYVDVVLFFFKC